MKLNKYKILVCDETSNIFQLRETLYFSNYFNWVMTNLTVKTFEIRRSAAKVRKNKVQRLKEMGSRDTCLVEGLRYSLVLPEMVLHLLQLAFL